MNQIAIRESKKNTHPTRRTKCTRMDRIVITNNNYLTIVSSKSAVRTLRRRYQAAKIPKQASCEDYQYGFLARTSRGDQLIIMLRRN